MSGFISNAGENFLLNLICKAVISPDTLWIALIVDEEPTKFSAGDELDEPTVSEYARLAYPNNSGSWSERTGEMSNTLQVASPALTGNEEWPTLRHWGILDADFGGNLLWAGSFDSPITLEEGDSVVFEPGSLTLRTASYMSRVSL